jgi:hypothetical protein
MAKFEKKLENCLITMPDLPAGRQVYSKTLPKFETSIQANRNGSHPVILRGGLKVI